MGQTVRAELPSPHHKALRMRGEANPKSLRTDEFKRHIGKAIKTALKAAEIEHKEAADAMGYGDNLASLSNWIRGEETPQFAKLWELGPRFQQELVIALASLVGVGVKVRTVVELERRMA